MNNETIIKLPKQVENLTSQLETKASNTTTDNIQKQINNLVLNGDGTQNLEVIQARDDETVINDRLNKIEKGDRILVTPFSKFMYALDDYKISYRYWGTKDGYLNIGVTYPINSNTNIYAYLPSATNSSKNAMWNVLNGNDYMYIDYSNSNLNANAFLECYFYSDDLSKYNVYKILLNKTSDSLKLDLKLLAKANGIDVKSYPYFYIYGIGGAKVFTEKVDIDVIIKGCIGYEDGLNIKDKLDNMKNNISVLKEDLDEIKNKPTITTSNTLNQDSLTIRKNIDSYYFSLQGTPSTFEQNEYLENKINSVPQGKHFIFVTDRHYPNNAKKSTTLMQYCKTRLGIKYVIDGGDILDRESDKYLADISLKKYMSEMKSAFGEDYLVAVGNHDLNTANVTDEQKDTYMIPYSIVYRDLLAHIKSANYENDSKYDNIAIGNDLAELKAYNKTHYFVDDTNNKIRYIIMNSGCPTNGVVKQYLKTYAIGELYLQFDWLNDILNTVPNDYMVVVVAHQFISYNTNNVTPIPSLNLQKILSARKTCSSVTINCNINSPIYSSGEHTYDFTGLEPIKSITLCGDNHLDVACVTGTDSTSGYISKSYSSDLMKVSDSQLVFSTQCDAYGVQELTNQLNKQMTKGTITEQCFDIVTITNDNKVVCTRVGAGTDRIFNLS